MSAIKGILFDKDGTLFDFSSTWEAWAAAFLRRAAADEAQAEHMGRAIGFDLALKRFAPDSVVIAGTPCDVAEMLAPHLPHLSRTGVLNLLNEEAEVAPQVEAVPLQAFLTDLRGKGYALGVVTNDAEAPARMHLTAAGITQDFDFIAGFDSGFGAKPAPGPLLAFAQACDLVPEHVLMVGDSTHDLIAAARAGMRGVGVLTGLADRATLAPYADVVLPNIGHLPDWLQAQNRTPN